MAKLRNRTPLKGHTAKATGVPKNGKINKIPLKGKKIFPSPPKIPVEMAPKPPPLKLRRCVVRLRRICSPHKLNSTRVQAAEVNRRTTRNTAVALLDQRAAAEVKSPSQPQKNTAGRGKHVNLANNRLEIEKILNNFDISNEVAADPAHRETNNNNNSIIPRKLFDNKTVIHTPKFFHRVENVQTDNSQFKAPGGRQFKSKTPLSIRRSAIFDFPVDDRLSKGAIASVDPTVDIVKKMIEQGKVAVARSLKGTGRTALKRQPGRVLKRKGAASTKPEKLSKKAVERRQVDVDPEPISAAPVTEVANNTSNNSNSNMNSSFSHLARSVLLQETRKNYSKENFDKIQEQREQLLEVARKFVSTPIRPQQRPADETFLSPIAAASPGGGHNPKQSPWRVGNDSVLPSAFQFNTNSTILPSFSSDHIPSTPRKSKTPQRPATAAPASDESVSVLPDLHSSASPSNSTRSSNDSNGENVPPTASRLNQENDANSDIFSRRHLPNPNYSKKNRSPLKAINIIEVISLPPWKKPDNNAPQAKAPASDHTNDELFGFGEFLDDDTRSDDEVAQVHRSTPIANGKQRLEENLRTLRRWLPNTKNKQPQKFSAATAARIFVDSNDQPKQRRLKDMLSSTRIAPAKSAQAEKINVQAPHDFFIDPEPETTLNEEHTPRTYTRLRTRKRKVAAKNVYLFSETDDDASEDDDEEEGAHPKTAGQKSPSPRKKRVRKEQPADDLNSFINEFQDMCDEVDRYQLVVDKSS